MIIIDTDILIEIYDKESRIGDAAFRKIMDSGDTFCITAINLHEIMYGLIKYAKPSEYILQLPVLGFSKEDAKLAAGLEFSSERKGRKPLRTDAMIAAIAINNNAKLYTNDKKHFGCFDGLELF
ncbi:MAG: type II toxin-antitoxin system VapC family toxin [Candidatus Micrarchaeaceae archaeon]